MLKGDYAPRQVDLYRNPEKTGIGGAMDRNSLDPATDRGPGDRNSVGRFTQEIACSREISLEETRCFRQARPSVDRQARLSCLSIDVDAQEADNFTHKNIVRGCALIDARIIGARYPTLGEKDPTEISGYKRIAAARQQNGDS